MCYSAKPGSPEDYVTAVRIGRTNQKGQPCEHTPFFLNRQTTNRVGRLGQEERQHARSVGAKIDWSDNDFVQRRCYGWSQLLDTVANRPSSGLTLERPHRDVALVEIDVQRVAGTAVGFPR